MIFIVYLSVCIHKFTETYPWTCLPPSPSVQWEYSKRAAQKKKAISCGSGSVSCFQMYQQTNTSCLELRNDDLTEINTISTGSLMGHKTHLIVGCHNAFSHIRPRRDIHVMSATAVLRQLAVQDSDRPSRLTVSDSYPGRALPHQSSPQGQTEVTAAPLSEC